MVTPKPIPFGFLLDYLPRTVIVKPAIGMFYLYYNRQIMLIFRKTAKSPQHNGIWIRTSREHHASLKAEIPAINDFDLEPGADSAWLLLSDDHEYFESSATGLCERVSRHDKRIGRVTAKSLAMR